MLQTQTSVFAEGLAYPVRTGKQAASGAEATGTSIASTGVHVAGSNVSLRLNACEDAGMRHSTASWSTLLSCRPNASHRATSIMELGSDPDRCCIGSAALGELLTDLGRRARLRMPHIQYRYDFETRYRYTYEFRAQAQCSSDRRASDIIHTFDARIGTPVASMHMLNASRVCQGSRGNPESSLLLANNAFIRLFRRCQHPSSEPSVNYRT